MKHLQRTKMEAELEQQELALRERLLAALPSAVQNGTELFLNTQFNSFGLNLGTRFQGSEALLNSARACLALRESLQLPANGSVGQLFIASCEERASPEPHSRGTRRIAESLAASLRDGV